jgi:hypothetical protein
VKLTLGRFEEQVEVLKSLEHIGDFSNVREEGPFSGDDNVIHVDEYYPSVDKIFELFVHHGLKGGWGVAQAKKHNIAFKESTVCFEGGLPLVPFFDAYVIVSPAYVQFSEPLFAV